MIGYSFCLILGLMSGIYLGIYLGIKLIKFNPGPPMRIIEEHEVSAYKDPTL
jgi:hypothetical protein